MKKIIQNNYKICTLKGKEPKNFYQSIMRNAEIALLEITMTHTNNNQLKSASILGINRYTLRKKLMAYDIISNPKKVYI